MKRYIVESEEEMINLGESYAKTLVLKDVVLLDGEMGAGKTVFAKGVARGLNIKNVIKSPTYAYMNNYGDILYHFDMYRLKCGEEAESLGLTDYFYGNGICLIEWAENIKEVLPLNVKQIFINKLDENRREVTIIEES